VNFPKTAPNDNTHVSYVYTLYDDDTNIVLRKSTEHLKR